MWAAIIGAGWATCIWLKWNSSHVVVHVHTTKLDTWGDFIPEIKSNMQWPQTSLSSFIWEEDSVYYQTCVIHPSFAEFDLPPAPTWGLGCLQTTAGEHIHEVRLLESGDFRNLHQGGPYEWHNDDCRFWNGVYFGKHACWRHQSGATPVSLSVG